MSSTLDASSDIKLDAAGNIDTSKLEKSLQKALAFDVQYKQKDNMKKRACKVAGNYDEFKAMVDCAHLKKVSRQEVESLRVVKRGWTKTSSGNISKGTSILSQEDSISTKNKQSNLVKLKLSSTSPSLPRTPLELERDFKRLANITDQIRYLSFVGVSRVIQLMNVDADAELFETLLSIISTQLTIPVTISPPKPTPEYDDEIAPTEEIGVLRIEWFEQLAMIKKFDLLYKFVTSSIKDQIKAALDAVEGSNNEILEKYKQ